MKTALLIVVESPPSNRTKRRVAAGSKMGPGICKIVVSAAFLEDDEVSRVNFVDVVPERTGT